MKVAHVLRKYDPREWGGTESAVGQLLVGLRRHGVSATVFAPAIAPVPPESDVYARAGIPVRRFRAFNPVLGLAAAEHRQLVSVGGNLLSFDAPLRLALEPGIDVVHTHALGRLAGIARLVARLRRVPFVVTVHGGLLDLPDPVREELARPLRRGLEWGKVFGLLLGARRAVADADAVLTCNPTEAERLRAAFPGLRVLTLPHAVPTELFAEADHRDAALAWLPALRGRRTLLVVGRIDPTKNQGWLVEQMPAVLARHPDCRLVLVGPTTGYDYAARVQRRIRELGLEERILLPGAVAPGHPRLVGLYQLAELVVQPSLSETFGLVLLEAWAARTAVLASRTSGALQLVRPWNNGALFDPDAPGGFHEALDRLLGDATLRRAMAAEGHAEVLRRFDAMTVAGRVKDLYDELRAAARGSRR